MRAPQFGAIYTVLPSKKHIAKSGPSQGQEYDNCVRVFTHDTDAPFIFLSTGQSDAHPKWHSLSELSRKDGGGRWRCLRMKVPASPRDASPKTDESELSSPSLSISLKWCDPETESKSG